MLQNKSVKDTHIFVAENKENSRCST